jgi:hypothetical protein
MGTLPRGCPVTVLNSPVPPAFQHHMSLTYHALTLKVKGNQ